MNLLDSRQPAVRQMGWFAVLAATVLLVHSDHTALAQDKPAKPAVITNSIGMKLVQIPSGEFVMGSPRNEAEREVRERQHKVVISRAFLMGAYEVTQRQYNGLMKPDRPRAVFTAQRGGGPDHPMETLLWQEAMDFCKKLSAQPAERKAGRTYRLPTEAQWEYACRAGTTTPFHFGNSLSATQANFNGRYPYPVRTPDKKSPPGKYLRRTAKVGSYKPNAFGLYDMHGNVAGWCADWYDKDYYRDSPVKDPLGPPVGVLPTGFGRFYLVVRGGCWVDDARACRAAYRHRGMPRNRYELIGFRVACDLARDTSTGPPQ